jgi:hypothetical protein
MQGRRRDEPYEDAVELFPFGFNVLFLMHYFSMSSACFWYIIL